MPTPKKQKNGKWSCQVYIGKDKSGKRKYKTDYTLKKRYQQLFDTQRKIVDQRIDDYFDQLFN